MQNVHGYFRAGLTNQTYRFIKTGPIPRTTAGLATLPERVIWRGSYTWFANTAFPIGKKHPNTTYSNFYTEDFEAEPVPSFGGEVWTGTLNFRGVFNPGKTVIQEEIGVYRQGSYFPKLDGGGPSIVLPGRPSGVNASYVNQLIPSFARKYITTTLPIYPTVDGSGVESKPANFVPPIPPAALTWLYPANATYTYPNGWYLASRNFPQVRLSDGTTVIPLWEVTEQWLYLPAQSTLL